MKLDGAVAARFVNQRVYVRFGPKGQTDHFLFRAYTPKRMVILANERTGLETFLAADMIQTIELAQITCPDCEAKHNSPRESARCTDCERSWAAAQPTPSETCIDCGALGAFYSPRSKIFGCTQCQAKRGGLTGSGAETRVLTKAAVCRTDDIHSERHSWIRTKSSWHCTNCNVKTFAKP